MASSPLVLLCGIPSEPPLAMAAKALRRLGIPSVTLSQRACWEADCHVEIGPSGLTGVLRLAEEEYSLECFRAVYTRLMDVQCLPELLGHGSTQSRIVHAQRFHEALQSWIEISPCRVVNRSRPMGSNASKPYQAQLIRKYFAIPASLVTNDPKEVMDFLEEHDHIVYKSVSGMRSVVTEFVSNDLGRLQDLLICPTLFQERIDGVDIRVHTVADMVFATAVESDAVDYRYAHHQGGRPVRLTATAVPLDVQHACVQLAYDLGLAFAGIDLRLSRDGQYYCFEVNPSPAYSYYEQGTGQPISEALAYYLGCGPDPERSAHFAGALPADNSS